MKMFRQGKRFGMVAMAILLSGALLLGSVVPAKAAEEKVVKIGLHSALTGVLATTGVPLHCGSLDYVNYLNEQGGIKGIKVLPMWEDTQGTVPRTMVTYRRQVAQGAKIVINHVIMTLEPLVTRLQADGIPALQSTFNTKQTTTNPQWVFASYPSGLDVPAATLSWFKENWTEERSPRLGVIIYEQLSAWEALEGVKLTCEALQMEFVGYELISMATIDTSTEWLRLAGKKVDAVFTGVCAAPQVVCIKDAARLEIQERGIILIDSGFCYESVLRVVGEDADGWYVAKCYPTPLESEIPGMKTVHEVAKRYRGWEADEIAGEYIYAWIEAMIAVEAIRLALEEVGFENLTGHAVRDALVRITDFDTGLIPPITLRDDKPYWTHGQRIYETRQGKIRRISEKWYTYAPLCKEWYE